MDLTKNIIRAGQFYLLFPKNVILLLTYKAMKENDSDFLFFQRNVPWLGAHETMSEDTTPELRARKYVFVGYHT